MFARYVIFSNEDVNDSTVHPHFLRNRFRSESCLSSRSRAFSFALGLIQVCFARTLCLALSRVLGTPEVRVARSVGGRATTARVGAATERASRLSFELFGELALRATA